jgi:imidazoleglycerol-phosphate dehydratase
MRNATNTRITQETQITCRLNLDGSGQYIGMTGMGFFDHMMTLLAKHAGFDLEMDCQGDLQVDTHHTVEDAGIVLGTVLKEALGDKRGIRRYGTFYCPMDETLTRTSLDLSGRGYLVYDVNLTRARVGDFETDMLKEFLYALAIQSGTTLHVTTLYGHNDHHIVESVFKSLGRALKEAVALDGFSQEIPSTKGTL